LIDLKRSFGHEYRITTDPSAEMDPRRSERAWYYRIPARYGWIGVAGPETLLAYCSAPRVIPRLLEIPGIVVRQRGDSEVAAAFGVSQLDDVARVLKAKRRRRMSPEARELATARLAASRFDSHSRAPDAAP
jgi:hypothetical protein